MLDRRRFLRAALFVAAAPIIVKAANIMPVRALAVPKYPRLIGTAEDPITHVVTVFGTDEYGLATTITFPLSEYLDAAGLYPTPGQWRYVDRISVV